MTDIVLADANHVIQVFIRALAHRSGAPQPDGQVSPTVADVADRILGILGVNGLTVVQAADVPA